MTIANNADLLAAVGNWLARSDLTSRIPEGVVLCEAKLNRILRTQDQTTKSATFSITGEYVAVPADFMEVRSFYLNTATRVNLEFMPDDDMTKRFASTGSKQPTHYNVQGGFFRFGPIPDATYSSTLVYFAKVPPLATNTTNWLITAHPDVYLYGTLLEMAGLTQDMEGLQRWTPFFSTAVDQMKSSAARSRWGGTAMSVRVA